MESTLVNKVAESGIITLNLEQFLPEEEAVSSFDIKPFLFREMIVKEKDFRQMLTEHDWSQYEGKHVAVFCSADAIIPMWAYMLIASYLQAYAAKVHSGNKETVLRMLLLDAIENIDVDTYLDKRVVIKGCGDTVMPEAAYMSITQKLKPVVKSLMFGEPCSTVPVYKKK
jgi:S-adenosylmethionine/arginine decarboxylase-like enzyme